jgi:hypothetical protein
MTECIRKQARIEPSLSLTEYIRRRLGDNARQQAVNLLARPFGAPTLAGFWRYWNPLLGYYLAFYLYRPLLARISRPAAVMATFALCGSLHDLPIGIVQMALNAGAPRLTMTTMFSLLGLAVVGSEAAGFTMVRWPVVTRWAVHAAIIYGSWRAALWVT